MNFIVGSLMVAVSQISAVYFKLQPHNAAFLGVMVGFICGVFVTYNSFKKELLEKEL